MKQAIIAGVLALFAFGAVAADKAAAKSPGDPVVGVWQLNVASSKFKSGPALKAQTRTYTLSGDELSLSMKTTSADGKDSASQTTYRLDGKDYAVMGIADYDGVSGKQLNSHQAAFELKKGGKVVGKTTRTVSHDGKKLTTTTHLTTADGKHSDSVLVFDRQ